MNNGLTYQEVGALAISPNFANDHTLYVTVWNGGIYRTTDAGENWIEYNNGQPERGISVLAFSPNFENDQIIFFGTWFGTGVYGSVNGGASWNLMNIDLTTPVLHTVVLSPDYVNDHLIFAGGEQTHGGGLWRYVGPSISGQIYDSTSQPISDVTVSINPSFKAISDANGVYILNSLIPGNYIISPYLSGYSFSPISRQVDVPPSKIYYDFVATPPLQACDVPFFSQRDDQWKKHPLLTTGECPAQCDTIGACGCTLTSSAMVFSYYGSDLIPPTLSDCMGSSACPFSWITGATCSNGKATYVGRYAFSWNRMDQELNQGQRPVILGMHKRNNPDDNHWVVVVSGQGSDPAGYLIHDPWFKGGAYMPLSARTRNYDLDWISIYSGIPHCPAVASKFQQIRTDKEDVMVSSTDIVTGNVQIYRITDTSMVVQLVAQSSVGNITEMLVWTNELTNPVWQPFSTLIDLPVSDYVYARFRDEYGNESGENTDTIFPTYTPTDPPMNLFFPIIIR
jgi:hypothetical protein